MRFSELAAVECAPQPVVVGVEIDVSAFDEGYNDLFRMPKGLAAVRPLLVDTFGDEKRLVDSVRFWVEPGHGHA